jgi:large subunit ribosomal protein L7/L12
MLCCENSSARWRRFRKRKRSLADIDIKPEFIFSSKEDVMAVTKDDVVGFIDNMTVLEMSQFVKELESKYGVTAAAAAVAVAAPAGGGGAAAAEAQTEFTVVLTEGGDKKIQVIKEVRTITGLGLKDAKDLVEGAPKTIKEGVSKEDAQKIKQVVEAAGGKVEIK